MKKQTRRWKRIMAVALAVPIGAESGSGGTEAGSGDDGI